MADHADYTLSTSGAAAVCLDAQAMWEALPELAARLDLHVKRLIESAGSGYAIQLVWRPAGSDGYEKWFSTRFFDTFEEAVETTYNTLEDETMANIFKVGDLFEYLAAEMIPAGRDVVMTITRVEVKVLHNQRGENERAILYFKETDKGLVVGSKTNVRQLVKLFGTAETDEWIGKRIALYSVPVQAFGKNVLAIRIRDYLPPQQSGKAKKGQVAAEEAPATNGNGHHPAEPMPEAAVQTGFLSPDDAASLNNYDAERES